MEKQFQKFPFTGLRCSLILIEQVTSWLLKRERSNLGKNTLLIPAHLILVRVKIMKTIDLLDGLTKKKLAFCFNLLENFVRV